MISSKNIVKTKKYMIWVEGDFNQSLGDQTSSSKRKYLTGRGDIGLMSISQGYLTTQPVGVLILGTRGEMAFTT